MFPEVCSNNHQSLFWPPPVTPSTWCADIAAPHRNSGPYGLRPCAQADGLPATTVRNKQSRHLRKVCITFQVTEPTVNRLSINANNQTHNGFGDPSQLRIQQDQSLTV